MCDFSYVYSVTFIKTLDRPESCMWCTIRCHKQCARYITLKFICMPKMYVFNKCYSLEKNWRFKVNEDAFKEGLQEIEYMKGKPPVFGKSLLIRLIKPLNHHKMMMV